MKRAFVLLDDGHLASALVPVNTKEVLSLGDRITVSRPLDLGYAAQIAACEGGTVAFVCALTGGVDVLLDLFHPGMLDWGNCLWLEPYGTEDIIGGIVKVCEALRAVA